MSEKIHPKIARAKAAGRNVVPGSDAGEPNGDGFKRTRVLDDGTVEVLVGKTWVADEA